MKQDRFTKRFARELKDTRENFARMTQQELSDASGINVCQISFFESGRRLPNLRNYAALIRALNTNAENMLGLLREFPE